MVGLTAEQIDKLRAALDCVNSIENESIEENDDDMKGAAQKTVDGIIEILDLSGAAAAAESDGE